MESTSEESLVTRYREALEDICALTQAGIVGETGLKAIKIAEVALLRP